LRCVCSAPLSACACHIAERLALAGAEGELLSPELPLKTSATTMIASPPSASHR
jgi:hypothetical protein